MSADGPEFSMTVRLRHAFGQWRVTITDDREKEITAEEALRWAEMAGDEHAANVRDFIRLDALDAEARAEVAGERAAAEVVSRAESALRAQREALVRRAEADRLAPAHEQPQPFAVGD